MLNAQRPLGLAAAAFAAVLVGLYAQLAAGVLLLEGVVLGMADSGSSTVVLVVLGAVYLALTVAAYVVGYGLWTRRTWAWAGGVAVFAAFIGANLVLATIADDPAPAIATGIGAAVCLAYLLRPSMRGLLKGPVAATRTDGRAMDVPSVGATQTAR